MTTSTRKRSIPRQRQPELERDFARSPSLGYEAPEDGGLVRCLAHQSCVCPSANEIALKFDDILGNDPFIFAEIQVVVCWIRER